MVRQAKEIGKTVTTNQEQQKEQDQQDDNDDDDDEDDDFIGPPIPADLGKTFPSRKKPT